MPPKLSLSQRQNLDAESRAMIYHGCSVNQLAELFNMRNADVMAKLAGLQPVDAGRQGNPIYRLREAATRLVKIEITPEMVHEYMQRANPKDFPAMSNKLFWEGLMARRKYEELTGELWHTADVAAVAAAVFQSLRMSLLLIPDTLMNDTGLTEKQLSLAQGIIDSALEDARLELVAELRKPNSELRPGNDSEEGEL